MRRFSSKQRGGGLAVLAFAALPATAEAHGQIPGLDEFVGGLLHPLLTPLHVLILLGLGLWIGQQSPLRLRTRMIVFILGSATGLLATLTNRAPSLPVPVLAAIALLAGGLVALAQRLPAWGEGILFGAAGLAIGLDSMADHATSGLAIAKTLLGTWFSLAIVLLNVGFYSSLPPRRQWIQIGTRVVGSWIFAISILILAFAIKQR